jgi:hypothetical protein
MKSFFKNRLLLAFSLQPLALANDTPPEPFSALNNDATELDADGWALIAPFGNHAKTRVFRDNGLVKEQKFIQVLDHESADALVNGENSFFRKLKRALIGIPVYKGHGDLNDVDPQAVANADEKIKLGVVDKIRKAEPRPGRCGGIEAHFALDNDGAEAVAAGWKLPSAFWLVMPIGHESLPDGQIAIRARPFKLLSVALTQFPNISGVESLANAGSGAGILPARTRLETHGQDARATAISGVEPLANQRDAGPHSGGQNAAKQADRQAAGGQPQQHTNDTMMKQLLIGWLAAQGIALANDATDQAVFEAFNKEMLNRSTSISALGNEKSTLNGTITTLTADRDAANKRADEADQALANEQTARSAAGLAIKTERRNAATLAVELAIQRGKLTPADRETKIAALENSTAFDADVKTLTEGKAVVKTEAVSGKQDAALGNEAAQARAAYQEAFKTELVKAGQDPIKAHNNVMKLPQFTGLAEKLEPKSKF